MKKETWIKLAALMALVALCLMGLLIWRMATMEELRWFDWLLPFALPALVQAMAFCKEQGEEGAVERPRRGVELDYSLTPVMRFKVMLGREGEAKEALETEVAVRLLRADGLDDTKGLKLLDAMLERIEAYFSPRVATEFKQQVLIAAVRTLEDAFYVFYDGLLARKVATRFYPYAILGEQPLPQKREQGNEQASKGKGGEYIDELTVIVYELGDLRELRRILGREMESYPAYADCGCELLTAQDLDCLKKELSHE